MTKQGEFHYTNSELSVAHFAYDNKMIVVGDKKGRVASYKLIIKDSQVKSVELVNEFKGLSSPVRAISVTFDHDLLACVEKGGKECQIFDFKTGSHIRNLTFSENNKSENSEFVSCVFSLNRKYLYTLMNTPS